MKSIFKWLIAAVCLAGVIFLFRSCPYNRSNTWKFLVQIDFKYEGDDSITTIYYTDVMSFNATVKYVEPEYYWAVFDSNGDGTGELRLSRFVRRADGTRCPTSLNVGLVKVPIKKIEVINVSWKQISCTEN